MSPLSYRVFHTRLIEGRDVAEVAQKLCLTREQVRYRQHRVLRKLRGVAVALGGQPLWPEPGTVRSF